jgi:hypothetical protein
MSSTSFVFNPQQVAPTQPREARAAGWYPAKGITESEVVPTQSGGSMLKITVEMEGGGFVWNNYNIANANQEVVQRAYADISALCQSIGINHQINDTRELHGRPFDVKLRVEKSEGYDDKNVIAPGGFAVLGSKADKYVRAAEPPRGAPFQPGAQFAGSPSAGFAQVQPQAQQVGQPHQQPQVPQQQAYTQQFTPPAPIQQPMPQAPQQFAPAAPFQQQAPQQFAQVANPQAFQQQAAAPQQFQPAPGSAPAWVQR